MKTLLPILLIIISFSCEKNKDKPTEEEKPAVVNSYNMNVSSKSGGNLSDDTVYVKINGVKAKSYMYNTVKTGDKIQVYSYTGKDSNKVSVNLFGLEGAANKALYDAKKMGVVDFSTTIQ